MSQYTALNLFEQRNTNKKQFFLAISFFDENEETLI